MEVFHIKPCWEKTVTFISNSLYVRHNDYKYIVTYYIKCTQVWESQFKQDSACENIDNFIGTHLCNGKQNYKVILDKPFVSPCTFSNSECFISLSGKDK